MGPNVLTELQRLHGGIRYSLEELRSGRNYSQVETILCEIDARFGTLLTASAPGAMRSAGHDRAQSGLGSP